VIGDVYSVIGDVRSGSSGPDCAGALERVKGLLAALAADAPLTRPSRSRELAITGATRFMHTTPLGVHAGVGV
jgi:hypothetical protein